MDYLLLSIAMWAAILIPQINKYTLPSPTSEVSCRISSMTTKFGEKERKEYDVDSIIRLLYTVFVGSGKNISIMIISHFTRYSAICRVIYLLHTHKSEAQVSILSCQNIETFLKQVSFLQDGSIIPQYAIFLL